MMSWLLAPQCSHCIGSGAPATLRKAARRAGTGTPFRAASTARGAGSTGLLPVQTAVCAPFSAGWRAGGNPVDPDYASAIQAFGRDLAREGAAVTVLDTAPLPLKGDADLYIALLFATIGADLPPEALDAPASAAAFPEGSLPARVARATRQATANTSIWPNARPATPPPGPPGSRASTR